MIQSQREGGGGIQCTQGIYVQDAAANDGASVLNLPGDLVTGRQTDGAPENREVQCDGVKTGVA